MLSAMRWTLMRHTARRLGYLRLQRTQSTLCAAAPTTAFGGEQQATPTLQVGLEHQQTPIDERSPLPAPSDHALTESSAHEPPTDGRATHEGHVAAVLSPPEASTAEREAAMTVPADSSAAPLSSGDASACYRLYLAEHAEEHRGKSRYEHVMAFLESPECQDMLTPEDRVALGGRFRRVLSSAVAIVRQRSTGKRTVLSAAMAYEQFLEQHYEKVADMSRLERLQLFFDDVLFAKVSAGERAQLIERAAALAEKAEVIPPVPRPNSPVNAGASRVSTSELFARFVNAQSSPPPPSGAASVTEGGQEGAAVEPSPDGATSPSTTVDLAVTDVSTGSSESDDFALTTAFLHANASVLPRMVLARIGGTAEGYLMSGDDAPESPVVTDAALSPGGELRRRGRPPKIKVGDGRERVSRASAVPARELFLEYAATQPHTTRSTSWDRLTMLEKLLWRRRAATPDSVPDPATGVDVYVRAMERYVRDIPDEHDRLDRLLEKFNALPWNLASAESRRGGDEQILHTGEEDPAPSSSSSSSRRTVGGHPVTKVFENVVGEVLKKQGLTPLPARSCRALVNRQGHAELTLWEARTMQEHSSSNAISLPGRKLVVVPGITSGFDHFLREKEEGSSLTDFSSTHTNTRLLVLLDCVEQFEQLPDEEKDRCWAAQVSHIRTNIASRGVDRKTLQQQRTAFQRDAVAAFARDKGQPEVTIEIVTQFFELPDADRQQRADAAMVAYVTQCVAGGASSTAVETLPPAVEDVDALKLFLSALRVARKHSPEQLTFDGVDPRSNAQWMDLTHAEREVWQWRRVIKQSITSDLAWFSGFDGFAADKYGEVAHLPALTERFGQLASLYRALPPSERHAYARKGKYLPTVPPARSARGKKRP